MGLFPGQYGGSRGGALPLERGTPVCPWCIAYRRTYDLFLPNTPEILLTSAVWPRGRPTRHSLVLRLSNVRTAYRSLLEKDA